MSSVEEGYVHSFEFKTIKADGETHKVVNARVAFGRSRYDKDKDEYVDTGTVWADLSLWGTRAESLADVLKAGASILAVGKFYQRKWKNSETGEDMYGMGFRAEQVGILPRCVQSVVYKSKGSIKGVQETGENFDDGIPF